MSFIESDALEALRGSALYYPSAGDDYKEPLDIFMPVIGEFWFVDITYFTRQSANNVPPLLSNSASVEFESFESAGPPIASVESRVDVRGMSYPFLEPCTRSEFYVHRKTNSRITVNRRRGFGQRSISLVPDIGVFFHRGDSPGESGSNVRWLSNRWVGEILSRLREGGLIVTDGSLAHVHKLRQIQRSDLSPEQAFANATPFERWGYRWTCLGWAGRRYGPTLIWKLCAV